jgi:hypothetical protein
MRITPPVQEIAGWMWGNSDGSGWLQTAPDFTLRNGEVHPDAQAAEIGDQVRVLRSCRPRSTPCRPEP